MGAFANPAWLKAVGYAVCTLIAGLNLKLLWDTIGPLWYGALMTVVALFSLYVKFGYKGAAAEAGGAPAPADA
jgi:manganese transport protein